MIAQGRKGGEAGRGRAGAPDARRTSWTCSPPAARAELLGNGLAAADDPAFDPVPLVKLFTPDGAATWLICWAQQDDDDLLLWGLCDLGTGCPEIGPVLLSELQELRGALGLPVERDLYFNESRALSICAAEALSLGYIRV